MPWRVFLDGFSSVKDPSGLDQRKRRKPRWTHGYLRRGLSIWAGLLVLEAGYLVWEGFTGSPLRLEGIGELVLITAAAAALLAACSPPNLGDSVRS